MRNKKIIAITVCLVAAVLVGMLGLSKFFETTWQNENTVDNSLSAEVVDDIETAFNYPYINKEIAENMEEKTGLQKRCCAETLLIVYLYRKML